MYWISMAPGILDGEHPKKIGAAIWEYMWCIDKITTIDDQQIGWVWGKKPVLLDQLKASLGSSRTTISRNLNKLDKEGYVRLIHTPYGITIGVHKAKKRFTKNGKADDQNRFTKNDKPHPENGKPRSENAKPNKTVSLDKALDRDGGDAIGPKVAELIFQFQAVNPSYERMFNNTTQREAAERLITKFGYDKMLNTVKALPRIVTKKAAPQITTPLQLENKLGQLILYVKQQEGDKREILGL